MESRRGSLPADFVVAILLALPVEVIRPARAETIATDTGPPGAPVL